MRTGSGLFVPLSLKDIRPDPGFRAATMNDAGLLYAWRIKAELAVDYPRPTTYEAHLAWLGDRIDNPLVRILIWGADEGTVRIDSNGELTFHADDDDVAVEMLKAAVIYANEYGGRLKVTADPGDLRIHALREAGFDLYPSMFLCVKP